jgi:hypothetical protein
MDQALQGKCLSEGHRFQPYFKDESMGRRHEEEHSYVKEVASCGLPWWHC